jgi:hypothetical protein
MVFSELTTFIISSPDYPGGCERGTIVAGPSPVNAAKRLED